MKYLLNQIQESHLWEKIDSKYVSIVKNFQSTAPVKLGALASQLNIKVFRSPLKIGVSGSIEFLDGNFIIRINRFEAKVRQRYTLAHEIAHYLLHQDLFKSESNKIIESNVLYRSNLPEKIEYEANQFASNLIMPTDLLRRELNTLSNLGVEEIVTILTEKFEVSDAAMRIRLGHQTGVI